jgi:hypothetical protein
MPADADGRLLCIIVTPDQHPHACTERDLSAHAGSFIAIWIAPIALAGFVMLIASESPWMTGAAWTVAFAWMGGACLLNARRCGRLHCYFSGPILLIGAVISFGVSVGAVELARLGLLAVVGATLGIAALTYGLEHVWGRYRR